MNKNSIVNNLFLVCQPIVYLFSLQLTRLVTMLSVLLTDNLCNDYFVELSSVSNNVICVCLNLELRTLALGF